MNANEIITPRGEPTTIGGIDYPDEVIRALLERRLVVFAGAGVSMGPPASLPDFGGLVDQVATGTGSDRRGEAHDRFLGVMESKGVDVHRRAARKLSNPAAEPTGLHRDLVRLAGPINGTRIVTTNFDTLFEGAAQNMGIRASVFNAPALPLGSSLNGIVHLHGSLDEPEGIVLTDTDVGRAYITEGWARRFLVQLFGSHTVLFVGYSHDDTIPEYLARAMPSVQPRDGKPQRYGRYILTDSQDNERWFRLGITPIGYPKQDHALLGNSLARLAKHLDRDLVDWDAELASVASSGPHAGQEQLESVRIALRKADLTRRFGVHAHGIQWLGWLKESGHLGSLFEDGELTQVDRTLGWWVAMRFTNSDSGSLNDLIEANDGALHPEFWIMLAQYIAGTKEEVSIERTRLLRTMMEDPPPQVPGILLQTFTEAGVANNDYRTATAAMIYLIRILLGLRRRTDAMVNIGPMLMPNQVDAYWVNASWHLLAPARDEIADEVLDVICRALEERVGNQLADSRSSVRSRDLDRPSKWSRRLPSLGAGIGTWANSSTEATVNYGDPVAVLRMILHDCLESLSTQAGTALNKRVMELAKSKSNFVKDVVFEHILTAQGEQPMKVIDLIALDVVIVNRVEDLFLKFVEREYSKIDEDTRRSVLTWIWEARGKSVLDIQTWLDRLASSHGNCTVAQGFGAAARAEQSRLAAELARSNAMPLPTTSPTPDESQTRSVLSMITGKRGADSAADSDEGNLDHLPAHLVELQTLLRQREDLYSRFSLWFDHMENRGIESVQRGAFETELVRSEAFGGIALDVARIYLAHGEQPDIYHFYGAIGILLEAEPGRVKRIWNEWLEELFVSRCEGVPAPVERLEAWFMFSLLRFLVPSVPNVVDVLTQLSGECNEFLELHRVFRTADIEAFPEQYARVLVHIGNHNENPVNWFGMREHLDMLVTHPTLSDELRRQLNGVRLKLGLDQPQ